MMNITPLAQHEGVSTTTVATWVRQGCPAPKSTRGAYRFVLKDVRHWWAENLAPRTAPAQTLTDARRRKENALAGLRELELRKRQGELVERSAVEKKLYELQRRNRDALFNIPARLSGILAAESSQDVVFQLLTKELQQALQDLADPILTKKKTPKKRKNA